MPRREVVEGAQCQGKKAGKEERSRIEARRTNCRENVDEQAGRVLGVKVLKGLVAAWGCYCISAWHIDLCQADGPNPH